MPLVSVVIPAYNPGHYLDEAVQSVIAQTFTDWECIVVDDGSTEDLSRVENMDPRVRLIRQPNRGISMARNRGIAESAGEFIAFLDHDDLFLPTKLERQMEVASADSSIGLVYTDFEVIWADGRRTPSPKPASPAIDFLSMLSRGAPLPTCTMVSRTALKTVGIFDPFLNPSEDQDLFIRIARFFRVVYVPTCGALYRVHENNTSKNYMVCYRTMRNLAQRHEINARYRRDGATLAAARSLMPYYRRNFFGPQAFDAARNAFRLRRPLEFSLHFSRALSMSPAYVAQSASAYVARRALSLLGLARMSNDQGLGIQNLESRTLNTGALREVSPAEQNESAALPLNSECAMQDAKCREAPAEKLDEAGWREYSAEAGTEVTGDRLRVTGDSDGATEGTEATENAKTEGTIGLGPIERVKRES